METRRVGEALLPSLRSFLAPSFARPSTLRHASPVTWARPFHLSTARCLGPTARIYADEQQSKPSSAEMPSVVPQPRDTTSDIDAALDYLNSPPSTSQGRTSHFASSAAPASTRAPTSSSTTSTATTPSAPSNSSIDDMFDQFSRFSSSSVPNTSGRRPASSFTFDEKFNPMRYVSAAPVQLPDPLPAYGPSVGRTVPVSGKMGSDVARAFRTLDIQCAKNRVRADFNRQRFHERGGLKRKRLRSERWRRRFKEGFRGMVRMVNQMKKQGW